MGGGDRRNGLRGGGSDWRCGISSHLMGSKKEHSRVDAQGGTDETVDSSVAVVRAEQGQHAAVEALGDLLRLKPKPEVWVYTAPAMTAVAVARTAANLSAKPSHCIHHVSRCAKGESGGTVYPAKASCDSQGMRRGGARGAGGCRVAPSKAAHQAEHCVGTLGVPTQIHFFGSHAIQMLQAETIQTETYSGSHTKPWSLQRPYT